MLLRRCTADEFAPHQKHLQATVIVEHTGVSPFFQGGLWLLLRNAHLDEALGVELDVAADAQQLATV